MGKINTVLLTGITGYLGRNLAAFLIDKGYAVIGIIREKSNLTELELIKDKLCFYNSDRGSIELAFQQNDIDLVIHTATSYGKSGEFLADVIESNILFGTIILEIALKYGVPGFINTDTALPGAVNLYALTKNHFKDILKLYGNQINIANMKLEYFFGPGDGANKFITYIINKMISNDRNIELSEGTQTRDFIFIDDVLEAYMTVILNLDKMPSLSDIPVGLGVGVTLKDLVLEIKAITQNTEIKLEFGKLPMRNDEVMVSIADITILKHLGWKPRFTLEEGLIKTFNIDKYGIYK